MDTRLFMTTVRRCFAITIFLMLTVIASFALPVNTSLQYSGSTLLGAGTAEQVSAILSDPNFNPISGQTVSFQVAGTQVSATTNQQGVASATLTLPPSAATGQTQA